MSEQPLQVYVTTRIASVAAARTAALVAEELGFTGVGVSDTAPLLFQALYPTVTAALLATSRLRVAPHVTNLVAQHWSVHASTARALDELAPGRFVLGLATGDGAVRSVGLKPATWDRLERDVTSMREHGPANLTIQVAASGARGAIAAGRVADDIIFGGGFDPTALRYLADVAAGSARDADRATPPHRWLTVPMCVVEKQADVAQARAHVRGVAVLTAHFAFRTSLVGRNIPERWQPALVERLARYQYGHHGSLGANANAELFSDLPELETYLIDRMVMVGTIEECRHRLHTLVADAGLDGVFIGPHVPPNESDVRAHLARVAAVALS
jgi:alkanesulfonate monooxygenase SsuD/methylene tetrahydromethanopterin reductase-like flavin-dependent oxidoreductase (luciferase family)